MTNNPESEKLEEILAGYVLGDLDEVELAWFNEQLATNPQIREQVKQLETALNLIPYGLSEDIVPQSDLRSKIFAQTKTNKSSSKSPKNNLSLIFGAIIALGVSTLWLGINNYSLRQKVALIDNQLQSGKELMALMEKSDNTLVSFKGMEELPTASGSLLIARQQQKAVLVLQNLKPLSGNQVYTLWAVSNGKKIGCADFTPDEQGKIHLEFSDNIVNQANSLVITVEPKPDMDEPQGIPIMKGDYSL